MERIDFLLIGALMPDSGACDTIQKLRQSLGQETAVIVLTPVDQDDVRDTCLERGADDFVNLPCNTRELSEVLVRHLQTDVD